MLLRAFTPERHGAAGRQRVSSSGWWAQVFDLRWLKGKETVDLLLTGRRLLGMASGFECSVVVLSLSFLASFSGSLALLFWRRCMYGWCIVVTEVRQRVVWGLRRIHILLGVWRGLAGLGLPLAGAGARSGWIGWILLRRHSCSYSVVWGVTLSRFLF